jgi:hypothetical protein
MSSSNALQQRPVPGVAITEKELTAAGYKKHAAGPLAGVSCVYQRSLQYKPGFFVCIAILWYPIITKENAQRREYYVIEFRVFGEQDLGREFTLVLEGEHWLTLPLDGIELYAVKSAKQMHILSSEF